MQRMIILVLLVLNMLAHAHVTRVPPTTTTARDELLLYFPGSGVKADNVMHANFLDHAASTLGFHVVALDYPDWPTVNKACMQEPSTCFGTVREQRLWGGGDITEAAAGIPQFMAELVELGWRKFLVNASSNEPDWSKIVVAGHSQGAGMALLVAKRHAVAGVVMLSGGGDFDGAGLAPWVTDASATPTNRLYVITHDADGMGKAKAMSEVVLNVLQMNGSSYIDSVCCSGAMLQSNDASFTCISQGYNCDAHFAVLDHKFSRAWTYTLTRQFNAVVTNSGGGGGATTTAPATSTTTTAPTTSTWEPSTFLTTTANMALPTGASADPVASATLAGNRNGAAGVVQSLLLLAAFW